MHEGDFLAKLPILSGKKLIKILSRKGFEVVGIKGSHARLKKKTNEEVIVTVIPLHKKLDVGTLWGILKQTKTSREELEKLERKK